jgi:hypothetical protein
MSAWSGTPDLQSPTSIVPLGWTGPGVHAFVAPCPEDSIASSEALGPEEAAALDVPRAGGRLLEGPEDLGEAVFAGDARGLPREVLDYFRWGGRRCVVAEEPGFERSVGWIGEDGGPGYRSGLHAVCERDDLGCVVAVGTWREPTLRMIREFATRRPDLFFLLEEEGSGEESFGIESDNVAVLRRPAWNPRGSDSQGWRGGSDGWQGASEGWQAGSGGQQGGPCGQQGGPCGGPGGSGGLGRLAALLEETDLRLEPAFHVRASAAPKWISPADLLQLQAWRRERGLLRSVDMATRWLLFEWNHPSLWRRAEREVTAFLGRLERFGFLRAGEGLPAFRVECVPVSPPLGPSGQEMEAVGPGSASRDARVRVSVRVRLAEPHGRALDELRERRKRVP